MRKSLSGAFFAQCGALVGIMGATLAVAAPALAQTASTPRVATTRTSDAPTTVNPVLAHINKAARESAFAARSVAHTLNYPYGLAVDSAGNLYAANVFGGVTIYSEATHKLTNTITSGLSYPAAVAISFAGNIYVANNAGNNITIYNPALAQIGTISDPTLYSPDSMYIDANDAVWALDATGVLHGYLDNGAALPSLTTGGTAVGPWGPNITVWGIANGPGSYSELYQNVGEVLHDGPSFQNDFVGGSPEAGGETQDAHGQQYVSDVANNTVQIWASNGLYQVAVITTPAEPFGLAVDNAHGRLHVALTTSNEILAYSTKAPYKLLFTIE
jgi:hypothetical protein